MNRINLVNLANPVILSNCLSSQIHTDNGDNPAHNNNHAATDIER